METPKRYHPLLVTLHWLILIVLLGAGFLSEDEGGGAPVNIHMALGAALLVLMVIRLFVRVSTKRPSWADTGNKYLNMLGEFVHWALYLAIFFILGMGAWIGSSRNLMGYLTGAGSVTHPDRALTSVHQLGWIMVLGLLFLHVAGAAYHQLVLKDNLLSRMWYGKG